MSRALKKRYKSALNPSKKGGALKAARAALVCVSFLIIRVAKEGGGWEESVSSGEGLDEDFVISVDIATHDWGDDVEEDFTREEFEAEEPAG